MKFSIITPSFNGGKYLRKCLESVRDQKNVEVEHIIQDAGSRDDTVEIIKEFPNVFFFMEKDLGMSDGINKGVQKATGDWWMWLNTDDYLLPGVLEKIQNFIEKNLDADVIYGNWNFVDSDGKFIKQAKVFPFNKLMMIHYGCYIASTATLFKKSSTIGANIFLSTLFKQVMDQEYYAHLAQLQRKFLHIPVFIAEFRIHETNTSMRYIGKNDLESIFLRQKQLAESATIRRTYGITISKDNPFINWSFDAILWYLLRIQKAILKFIYGGYLR